MMLPSPACILRAGVVRTVQLDTPSGQIVDSALNSLRRARISVLNAEGAEEGDGVIALLRALRALCVLRVKNLRSGSSR